MRVPLLNVECSVFLGCKQDLTRFPLFRDLFRQINFNERLIRNIFFIGQDLDLIEHLARQSKRNRFHRSFDARVKFNFDPALLGKIEVVRGVMRDPKFSLVLLVFELRHRLSFLFHTLSSRFCSSGGR